MMPTLAFSHSLRLTRTAPVLRSLALALCCAGLLSACSVAPVYQVPSTPAPASFKEAGALWQSAQPNDAVDRGD